MEFKEANNILLADILGAYDRTVIKAYPGYDMYQSPFRDEQTPSFKVNTTTNRWQDFAEGTFGTVIDLVMRLEKCSFSEAMKVIEKKNFTVVPVSPAMQARNIELQKQSKLHILKIAPLQNKILINYAGNRGIDAEYCQKYCQEIYYKIGEEGKTCFALGFKNNSGGYEIRNPMFKGCNSKDITYIDNGSQKCAVFEGFFDMLSYLQLMKDKPELQNIDIVVLNTTAMVSKAKEFIQKHAMVHSFLDNDASGRSTFQAIKRMGVTAVNESEYLYPQHNDLNAYLQESIKKKQVNDFPSETPQQKEKEVKSKLKI